jgi:hypothetical protein
MKVAVAFGGAPARRSVCRLSLGDAVFDPPAKAARPFQFVRLSEEEYHIHTHLLSILREAAFLRETMSHSCHPANLRVQNCKDCAQW